MTRALSNATALVLAAATGALAAPAEPQGPWTEAEASRAYFALSPSPGVLDPRGTRTLLEQESGYIPAARTNLAALPTRAAVQPIGVNEAGLFRGPTVLVLSISLATLLSALRLTRERI